MKPPKVPKKLLEALVNLLTPEKVLLSERRVDEAARPALAERVVPLKIRPLPMESDLMKLEPLPSRMPPSGVEEPVPPPPTPRAPESVGMKVKIPLLLVML